MVPTPLFSSIRPSSLVSTYDTLSAGRDSYWHGIVLIYITSLLNLPRRTGNVMICDQLILSNEVAEIWILVDRDTFNRSQNSVACSLCDMWLWS